MLAKVKRKIALTKHNSTPAQHKGSNNKTNKQIREKWSRENIGIAHVNVRGINSTYKRQSIENWAERKTLKIIAITETHHPYNTREGGKGKNTPEGYTKNSKYRWYFSTGIDPKMHDIVINERKEKGRSTKENYENTREHRGVAILIHKDYWPYIHEVEHLGGRIMRLSLNFKKKLEIIATYAPTAKSNDIDTPWEVKKEYYETLQECINKMNKKHMKLIMGDFNARVMKATTEVENTVIGKHALCASYAHPDDLDDDTTRDNRDRLIEWCIDNNMKIENTMFQKTPEKTSNIQTAKRRVR